MACYVVVSQVKQRAHEAGKQVSESFLEALDRHIEAAIGKAAQVHNGGRARMDATVLDFVIGKLR